MEQLNKVELKGVVRSVNIMPIGNSNITRFTVATKYNYADKDATPIVETTWHSCVSFDKKAAELKMNDKVHLLGRIRYQRYMDSNGEEKRMTDILVNKLEILN